MADETKEKYINPYTDFGFQKLFEQAEIAKYTEAERRLYEASQKEYWDYTSTLETAQHRGEQLGAFQSAMTRSDLWTREQMILGDQRPT